MITFHDYKLFITFPAHFVYSDTIVVKGGAEQLAATVHLPARSAENIHPVSPVYLPEFIIIIIIITAIC